MIVVDTSVLVAIYQREPEALLFYETIARSDQRLFPPSCKVEFALLHRYGRNRRAWLAKFVEVEELTVPAFSPAMAEIAADAAERYGHGSGHPARLNFGDCLSYAVAKHMDAPLLYKGGDFALTDIESALAP